MTSVEKSAAFLDLQSTAIALAEAGIRRFAPRSRRAVLGDSTSTTKAGADVILAFAGEVAKAARSTGASSTTPSPVSWICSARRRPSCRTKA